MAGVDTTEFPSRVRAVAGSQAKSRSALFVGLWLFIIFVSVVDGYLVFEHRHHLEELNPQGQLLIALNGGEVWLLLAAKFLGTVVACAFLLVIRHHRAGWGTAIAAVIAGLQLGLLVFLLWA
jgi:hypothetical protein